MGDLHKVSGEAMEVNLQCMVIRPVGIIHHPVNFHESIETHLLKERPTPSIEAHPQATIEVSRPRVDRNQNATPVMITLPRVTRTLT